VPRTRALFIGRRGRVTGTRALFIGRRRRAEAVWAGGRAAKGATAGRRRRGKPDAAVTMARRSAAIGGQVLWGGGERANQKARLGIQ
jgi:hypothetical protein